MCVLRNVTIVTLRPLAETLYRLAVRHVTRSSSLSLLRSLRPRQGGAKNSPGEARDRSAHAALDLPLSRLQDVQVL